MKKESQFVRIFQQAAKRYDKYNVWSDFVTIAACVISNIVDEEHYVKRDELWKRTISKYNDGERRMFTQLYAEIAEALTRDPEKDFLGAMYMRMGLHSKEWKQEFTPSDVSLLVSRLAMNSNVMEAVQTHGYITINDPACGAGSMLLSSLQDAAMQISGASLDWHNHILVTGQDISFVAAMMCYIQLSMVGVAGYIKVGNTLTDPMSTEDSLDDYWFTPTYFSSVWQGRRIIQWMRQLG